MNKKRLFAIIAVAVASVTLSCTAYYGAQQTAKYLRAVPQDASTQISEIDLKTWATELASDEYGGRQAGYPGNDKAARYIAKQLEKFGVAPAGNKPEAFIPEDPDRDKRTYFQHFEYGRERYGTQNVVGMIEGSDPVLKKQIIVLGAHFDHVGQTGVGSHYARLGHKDGIWHGADDNASGTVTVMAIAKAFATGKWQPKRTIIFILFSAEEDGLIGSAYFCKYPTIGKIEDYVFMLNLDMVGRNPGRAVEIKGMASADGTYLSDVVNDAVAKTKLSSSIQAGAVVEGGDSDHSSFGDQGIPFVFFFTGFHEDYHKVTDTADKLAYDHMALIGKTAFFIMRDIADRPSPPIFKR